MNKYELKIIKKEVVEKSFQLLKDGILITEGKATTESLFRLYIDKFNPQINFVENFSNKDNG